jgi:predicted permease
VEGRTPAPGEAFINTDIRVVGGDYFRAMEIPLLGGRLFDDHDTRTTHRVIVVDEAFARELWPGESAIGKRVRQGGFDVKPDTPWLTVVGVVGRIKQDRLDADSRIALYHPQTQTGTRAMNVTVRSRQDGAHLAAAVTREVRGLDPDLPVYGMRTMKDRVDESVSRRRFSMLLLSLFAGLALVLGIVGTYGVMAYQVSQGTRELGIRLALGAAPGRVLAFVLRRGMAIALPGVALGVVGALALSRLLRSMLFGIETTDPLTFLVVPAVLVLAALGASYMPARRAARIDPCVSLRSE